MRKRNGTGLRRLIYSALLTSTWLTPALAGELDRSIDFEVAAQALDKALLELSKQADFQMVLPTGAIPERRVPRLAGKMTVKEALQRLLQGTDLSYKQVGERTLTVVVESTQRSSGVQDVADEVVVTGSHIRGGEAPSPVITIDAERIREQGFTDLGQVIRSVPQNFSGGQNPGIVGAVGNVANQDVTGGSGLNLRGLGPDATLTLLNGRRLSYEGEHQSVDISAIPVAAVERLEIVADGASAIYGSDAVGGVGNVILKRDFDGVTLGARYGAATDGGLTTREYNATAGTTWSGGGFIATYQDVATDPIYKDQRDFTRNMVAPYTIYSGSDLRSGLLSAHQSLGGSVEVRLDALLTEREQLNYAGNPSYYLYATPKTQTRLVSPSADISLPGDWTLTIGASWGEGNHHARYVMVTPATGTSSLTETCVCNESRSYDASIEGPLFSLGGGAARLAIGAGERTNKFLLDRRTVGNNARFGGDDSGRFAYAEISLPFIGPESSLAGIYKLALTAAMRGEDYDDFGSVSTPKLGLVYAPNADVTLKASWGKSFKAPTLSQRNTTSYVFLDPANWYGSYPAGANVLFVSGGNPDVGPERARTWTASLAVHPESIPALEAELSGFNIDYTDRVVYPVTYGSLEVLSNPANAPYVIFSPSVDQQAAAIASVGTNYAGGSYDTNSVIAILTGRYTNAALQEVRGIDLSGSYRFDLGTGRLTLRGSASWLDSSQQTTAGQAPFDLAGNRGSPADINARLGAVWELGAIMASAFVNYTDGITIGAGTGGVSQTTASFTTIDATLRYDASVHAGAWSGMEFVLSAQNLFDKAPPLYRPSSATAVRYDSTNYSAIGRFLSVSIAKHW